MNYFAHLHIAAMTNTSWMGNLLGDFLVTPAALDEDLLIGWRLHQQVDVMVDQHVESVAFRAIPRKGRRRFAGIIQDIVMDYWLIQYWERFSSVPLILFCDRAVSELVVDKGRSPERLANLIGSLETHNWLPDLGTQEGVNKAISSIMRRWRYGHYLQDFIDELPEIIQQGEKTFLLLYPDLLDFVGEEAERIKKTETAYSLG